MNTIRVNRNGDWYVWTIPTRLTAKIYRVGFLHGFPVYSYPPIGRKTRKLYRTTYKDLAYMWAWFITPSVDPNKDLYYADND